MGRRTAGKGGGRETGRNGQSALCPRVVYSTRRPVTVLMTADNRVLLALPAGPNHGTTIGRSAGEAARGGSVQVVGALADGRDSPGRVTLDGARAASSSLSTLEGAADREANAEPRTNSVAASAKMSIATLARSKITSSPCDAAVSPARLFLTNDSLSRLRRQRELGPEAISKRNSKAGRGPARHEVSGHSL
jgi:hypothetical protein